jgi:hypothetical protein
MQLTSEEFLCSKAILLSFPPNIKPLVRWLAGTNALAYCISKHGQKVKGQACGCWLSLCRAWPHCYLEMYIDLDGNNLSSSLSLFAYTLFKNN